MIEHVFFRLLAPNRIVLAQTLNSLIPGQWCYSHYAVTPSLRDGNGIKPHLILVQDHKAATKLLLTLGPPGSNPGGVTVKQSDRVELTDAVRRLVLYGGKTSFFPWEEEVLPVWKDWHHRDGYVLITPSSRRVNDPVTDMLTLKGASFGTRTRPFTLAEIRKKIGQPFWYHHSSFFSGSVKKIGPMTQCFVGENCFRWDISEGYNVLANRFLRTRQLNIHGNVLFLTGAARIIPPPQGLQS